MTKDRPAKEWMGSDPICNFCQKIPTDYFIDGRTQMGPWALMCPTCHKIYGVGLGTGRGQQYDAKTLKKVAG